MHNTPIQVPAHKDLPQEKTFSLPMQAVAYAALFSVGTVYGIAQELHLDHGTTSTLDALLLDGKSSVSHGVGYGILCTGIGALMPKRNFLDCALNGVFTSAAFIPGMHLGHVIGHAAKYVSEF